MSLAHGFQCIGRAPGHQPEVAGVGWDVDVAHVPQHPIEGCCRSLLESGFSGACAALAVNDVGALTRDLVHVVNQLRWVLQVGVDDRHEVALGVVDAGRDGDLVAEVSAQGDDLDAGVGIGSRTQLSQGAVLGAIVDEHELEIDVALVRRLKAQQAPNGFGDGLLLIEDGNNNADGGFAEIHCVPNR